MDLDLRLWLFAPDFEKWIRTCVDVYPLTLRGRSIVSMTGQFINKVRMGSPVSHICDSSPHSVTRTGWTLFQLTTFNLMMLYIGTGWTLFKLTTFSNSLRTGYIVSMTGQFK